MTPFISDPDFTLHVGDVRDVLAKLPDESVHCVVTSPPYWGLRDYGTGLWDGGDPDCDHVAVLHSSMRPERSRATNSTFHGSMSTNHSASAGTPYRETCGKCGARRVDRQLGLEATPDLYVENMVAVFREVRRVLRRDGTCWLNLGDSYAADHAQKYREQDYGLHAKKVGTRARDLQGRPPGLKPKDLVGVPWRVAFALQADGWYLRADVVWSKPNPMPESVTDRPTKAHEYLFLLTRSPRYFFDQDAIREPAEWAMWGAQTVPKYNGTKSQTGWMQPKTREEREAMRATGRNRRSVWEIATESYPDAHFATFPQALVEPCVKAGTSERGCCPECGAPWEREVERGQSDYGRMKEQGGDWRAMREVAVGEGKGHESNRMHIGGTRNEHGKAFSYTAAAREFLGWRPSCGHGLEPVPCTVLDPFMGSGTTALVARRLGRRSIGVELNETYAELAARRLAQLSLLA